MLLVEYLLRQSHKLLLLLPRWERMLPRITSETKIPLQKQDRSYASLQMVVEDTLILSSTQTNLKCSGTLESFEVIAIVEFIGIISYYVINVDTRKHIHLTQLHKQVGGPSLNTPPEGIVL